MDAAADNMTVFTGVLLKRQYRPGQHYIQLLFQTTDGLRLSLSRNLHMVRGLTPGQTYRVEGIEFAVGDKTFVHDPIATAVKPGWSRKRKGIILGSMVLILSLGGAVSAMVLTPDTPAPAKQGNSAAATSQQTALEESSVTPQVEAAATQQPAPTAPTNTTTSRSGRTIKATPAQPAPAVSTPTLPVEQTQPPIEPTTEPVAQEPSTTPAPDPTDLTTTPNPDPEQTPTN